jgi:hypothetical protein
MSLAIKLDDNEIHRAASAPRYQLTVALLCIGLALAIACVVFKPVAIGHVPGDQIFLVGL